MKIFTFVLTIHLMFQSNTIVESACAGYDCLKEYIDKPDENYAWTDTGIRLQGLDPLHLRRWDGYVLNFTSQQWLTPEGLFTFIQLFVYLFRIHKYKLFSAPKI